MIPDDKLKKLENIIEGYDQMVVAFSGGVDSAFLLAFAREVYGRGGSPDRVAALTATGPQFMQEETVRARELCDMLGVSHKVIDVSHIMGMIKRNPPDRCYHCKRELLGVLKARADMVGSVLADGTNADDLDDYRPGYRAVCEMDVRSPLLEAGLTKEEIRQAMRMMNDERLSAMADSPACACLASRIPYGETITEQKLRAVQEAERFLREQGFAQVRVRCHEIAGKVTGNEMRFMARIELECEDMSRFFGAGGSDLPTVCEQRLRDIGFEYVTLDLGGYEKGRMNGILESGVIREPDRIKVTETVVRGDARKAETADVMAKIDEFLDEIKQKKYSFRDFIEIIERLRRPDGCPWDREQTHESLKKHMVEEANEALEAIDEEDWDHLCEELGDVLLQIVLHAQIAREAGEFDIDDVIQCVSEKMIRRHPHVFGDIDVSNVDEGLDLWEEIKKRERMQKSR